MKIPNRYECCYLLEGGIIEMPAFAVTSDVKSAKFACNVEKRKTVIIDKCRYDRQIKP